MVSPAPNRLSSLMFIVSGDCAKENLDEWLREFYGDPLTGDDLRGVVADFEMLLSGPLDAGLRATVMRLRDAVARTTTRLSPPPQPKPQNGSSDFDQEAPTQEADLPSPRQSRPAQPRSQSASRR